jgi:hypothetical protein
MGRKNTNTKRKNKNSRSPKKKRSPQVVFINMFSDKPPIMVGFHGEMTTPDKVAKVPVVAPSTARMNTRAVKTFMNPEQSWKEHLISGLWSGGSRDFSSATPRVVYHARKMKDPLTRCGEVILPNELRDKNPRLYTRGSVEESCVLSPIPLFRASKCRSEYRELRDAVYAQNVRKECAIRGTHQLMNYCGDGHDLLHRCLLVQASQWALFYAEMNFMVNMMVKFASTLYTSLTGFNRTVCPLSKELNISVRKGQKTPLTEEVNHVLMMIADFIVVAVHRTPSLTSPWNVGDMELGPLLEIGNKLSVVCMQLEKSNLLSLIPKKRTTMGTRERWTWVFKQMHCLNVCFKTALSATHLTKILTNGGGLFKTMAPPHSEAMEQQKVSDPRFYASLVMRDEFRRLIKEDEPPCFAFTPFDYQQFIAYHNWQCGDKVSSYFYMSPFMCYQAYKSQDSYSLTQLMVDPFAVKGNSSLEYFLNALGPQHKGVMEMWFEKHAVEEIYSRHSVDTSVVFAWAADKCMAPAFFSSNWSCTSNSALAHTEVYTATVVRFLMDGNLAQRVSNCRVLNLMEWFPEVNYMSTRDHVDSELLRRWAAVVIQRRFRDYLTQRGTERKVWSRDAAHTIQRAWRMRKRRQTLLRVCAVFIQAAMRGHWVRQTLHEKKEKAVRLVETAKMIQCIWRRKAREREQRIERQKRQERCAAKTIQRRWKGYVRNVAMCLAVCQIQTVYRNKWKQMLFDYRRVAEIERETMRLAEKGKRDTVVKAEKHKHAQRKHRVEELAKQIAYFFEWNNLLKDQYLLANMDATGAVPYEILLQFPTVVQYTCTSSNPIGLLIEASRHVKYLVVTKSGLRHTQWVDYVQDCWYLQQEQQMEMLMRLQAQMNHDIKRRLESIQEQMQMQMPPSRHMTMQPVILQPIPVRYNQISDMKYGNT